ncbi:MAG: N-acetylmuramoyl-L-alanine amidase [Chitinophagaceae bacterium]|nr:N-acetylmuramoyl-L-alanine amidase [Chitinophagaceae bacterium]
MLAVAYYLLKVIICSGILYGYYRLALHNKIFHRWNRFYLLGAVIMSLSFPLITISIFHTPAADDGQVIRLLNVVTTGDAYIQDANSSAPFKLTDEALVSFAYIAVSLVFLLVLLQTLVRLRNIVKHHPTQKVEGIYFVDTDAKGTPFSFFSYIFWNRNISIDSETGRKVFLHELAHVKEKHSADRLFMNITMVFFWSNPFFWLIRREMNMIHEFIADSESVDNNDTAGFAAMILQVAYPQRSFGLTSNFFSSSIKRRILMLKKMQTPRTSYISRVLVLPLLAIVFVAFTIRTKQLAAAENLPLALEKKINIIIDAGHGGTDPGAKGKNGIAEKDITLSLAKKIQALNSNSRVNIILTRSEDVFQPVKEKVDFSVKQKADAFISIHVAATPRPSNTGKGFEIYLSRKMDTLSTHAQKARLLASIITEEIAKTYTIATEIKRRIPQGIWVLDADQINYPALLIECGYITDSKDLGFLLNEKNQETVAGDILKAIERYAKAVEENTGAFIEQPNQEHVVEIEASGLDISSFIKNQSDGTTPLLVVNGKETKQLPQGGILLASSPKATFKGTIYPKNNAKALAKYGEAARFGALIIEEIAKEPTAGKTGGSVTPKLETGNRAILFDAKDKSDATPPVTDSVSPKIKSIDVTNDGNVIIIYKNDKAEKISRQEAVKRKLLNNEPSPPTAQEGIRLRGISPGNEPVYFIDGKEATKAEVDQLNPRDIEEISVWKDLNAIEKYGLKARNGAIDIRTKNLEGKFLPEVSVVAYGNKIFTKAEQAPTFPGGDLAWARHISRAINKDLSKLTEENKQGTCIVRFVVSTDGTVSDVEALTMKGTQLAKSAVAAVENGPKWNPAVQNGKVVKAYHSQPVSFTFSTEH